MSRILICLFMVAFLLGCGRGERGGDDSKTDPSEQNTSQSKTKSDSDSANGEITIDAAAQEKAGIRADFSLV